MIIVDDCIVSDDIAECRFGCSLECCKGMCCIEGDAGAPLDADEIPLLQSLLPKIEPYMTPEGIEAVHSQSVAAADPDGQPTTTLVNNRECAFVVQHNGVALCAIESAFRNGDIDFRKPVSCHLYPIRVDDYGEFRAVNYHRWNVCQPSLTNPDTIKTPLYVYLKEPLVRKFGQAWYDELVKQIENTKR